MIFSIRRFVSSTSILLRRISTTSQNLFKVTVLGAAGSVGQPLSLLLKRNSLISNLALYDINNIVKGVACDTSHCSTITKVYGYSEENIGDALTGSNIIIILAGHRYTKGKDKKEHFHENAEILTKLTHDIVRYSPHALVAILTDPINCLVPMVSEIMCKRDVYDSRRIFGITALDLLRATKFASVCNKTHPRRQIIPVIGGHSAETKIPLLSRASPSLDKSVQEELTKRIQYADSEVLEAEETLGSAYYLATAYATARFTNSLLRGLWGECGVVDYAFVRSNVRLDVPLFAGPVHLSTCGVGMPLPYGPLSPLECELINCSIPYLVKDINDGISYCASSN